MAMIDMDQTKNPETQNQKVALGQLENDIEMLSKKRDNFDAMIKSRTDEFNSLKRAFD